jgi:hypothetical protein
MSHVESGRFATLYRLTDLDQDIHTASHVASRSLFLTENMYHSYPIDDPSTYGVMSNEPLWLRPTVSRLEEILSLSENWDSYGAEPVSFENAEYAVRFLDFVASLTTPAPFIAPTPEGSVQLEWHRAGIDLEVEIVSPYRLCVSYEDGAGRTKSWEEEVTTDLTRVREAIQELSRRVSPLC